MGEALIDRIEQSGSIESRPGGSPYNVAIGLGRLGVATTFLGRLSTDANGQLLRARLVEAGVDVTSTPIGPEPTAVAHVRLEAGQPTYRFDWTETADRCLTRKELPTPLPDALHVGSVATVLQPAAAAILDTATDVADRGGMLSWDPNVRLSVEPDRDRWQAVGTLLCVRASLVKLSEEDLAGLRPSQPPAEAIASISHEARGIVLLTRGEAGAEAWSHGRQRAAVEAVSPARMIDTVGAGDSFMAAALAWLHEANRLMPRSIEALRDDELASMMQFAAQAATRTCERAGADPPGRDELG